MKPKLKTAICVIVFIPLYLLLYTFLHEGGHALVILAYGGTIDNFVLGLNAHVSSHGAVFTVFGAALNHAAGMLFPTIIGAIAIILYKDEDYLIRYSICYLCVTVGLASSILTWVVIPIVSLFANPPEGDDVTNFLNITGFHPLFVTLGALLLAGAFLSLAYKKGIFTKAKEVLRSPRKSVKAGPKQRLFASGAALLAAVAAVIFIVCNMGYSSVVFNTSFITDNVLENKYWECTFDIEKAKSYSVDFTILSQGVITAIRIMDENGELVYQNLGEDSSFTMQTELSKGVYTLSLTYLVDYEAVKDFLENMNQGDLVPDESNYYKEVFSQDTNYSASFSIKIR